MDVGVPALARRRCGAGERSRRGAHQLRRVRLEREVHVVSRDLHPNPRGVVGFLLPPLPLHDGHERRVPRDGSMHPSSRPNRSRRRPRTITTRGGACPLGRGRERGFAGRVRAARSRGRAVDTAPTDAPRVVASAPPRREPLGEDDRRRRLSRSDSCGSNRAGAVVSASQVRPDIYFSAGAEKVDIVALRLLQIRLARGGVRARCPSPPASSRSGRFARRSRAAWHRS